MADLTKQKSLGKPKGEDIPTEEEDALKGKFLTFHLYGEDYAIETRYVTEIIGIQEITEVPDMPIFIRGAINLRGHVIPVMDVRARFGFPDQEYNDRTCIVVVELAEQNMVGLVVDEVNEVVDIPESVIDKAPTRIDQDDCVAGLGKIDDTVKILLNIEKLIEF